jgi:hypothetical protein
VKPVTEDDLAHCLGLPVSQLETLAGGLTSAKCCRAALADGRTVFVKIGYGQAADDVRHETRVLRALKSQILPDFVAALDAEVPFLITEDLSDARWDVPSDASEVLSLMESIEGISLLDPPDWLPRASLSPPNPWKAIRDDGSMALRMGQDPSSWPGLVRRLSDVRLQQWRHDAVVHGDLAPGNWCLSDRGWVFTDWATTRIADSRLDAVTAAIRLRAAGMQAEPHVEDLAGVVSLLAGFLLLELAEGAIPNRAVQSKESDAATALGWAIALLS